MTDANPTPPPQPPPAPAAQEPVPPQAGNGGASATWKQWNTWSLIAIVAAIVVVGLRATPDYRRPVWIAVLVLLVAFAFICGKGITGLWRGAFIDERNRISLSRLQMLVWTVVVLAAYLTGALSNIQGDVPNPLYISIPEQLLVLMGIATTSLVTSPALQQGKREKQANPEEVANTLQAMSAQGVEPGKVGNAGHLLYNRSPRDAKWSDLFSGEEVGNGARMDLGKIQMFYFTVVAVIAYASDLGGIFSTNDALRDFPELSNGLVWLLGISHAGYLSNKTVSRSRSPREGG